MNWLFSYAIFELAAAVAGSGGGSHVRHITRRRRSQNGWAALIWAARWGHSDCTRLLLNAGTDTNVANNVRARACACVGVGDDGMRGGGSIPLAFQFSVYIFVLLTIWFLCFSCAGSSRRHETNNAEIYSTDMSVTFRFCLQTSSRVMIVLTEYDLKKYAICISLVRFIFDIFTVNICVLQFSSAESSCHRGKCGNPLLVLC